MKTFCPECGPGVKVDEDGCCVDCGATATGKAVDTHVIITKEQYDFILSNMTIRQSCEMVQMALKKLKDVAEGKL